MQKINDINKIRENDTVYLKQETGDYTAITVASVVNKSVAKYIVGTDGTAYFLNNLYCVA